MNTQIQNIYTSVIEGNVDHVESAVNYALKDSLEIEEILNLGLIAPMKEVGDRFGKGELFLPEMLIAARAMQSGLNILKPYLIGSSIKSAGKIVIGTVKGDLHDIGKNIVGLMLESAGFEVIDLGADVDPSKFASAIGEFQPLVVGMSALLTTTMESMKSTIEAIENTGGCDGIKIIVGGAPVNQEYATLIGANGYASDASRAVTLVKQLLNG